VAYIGQKPADKPLGASDITDGIISNAKLAQDIISAETELAEAPADTDEFLISDAGVLKRLDASFVGGGGKVNQLVSTIITSVATVNSTSFADMSGCNVSITPSATNSKILLFGSLVLTNKNQYSFGKFVRSIGGASYADVTGFIGDASGSRIRSSFQNAYQAYDAHQQNSISFHLLDNSHNTTSAITYKLQVRLSSGSSTIILNRDPDDDDDTSSSRTVSTIHAMEILA